MAVTALTVFLVWQDGQAPAAGNPGSTTTTAAGDGSTTTTASTAAATRVGYLISRPGARYAANGVSESAIAGQVAFAVLGEERGGYRVMDVCNREGWIAADQVEVGEVLVERNGFADAAIVLDAGHGLPDKGAIGPTRLIEAEANLDVTRRLAEMLESPHDIDWATGAVSPGSAVPAARNVVVTRSHDGPNGGDFELGLTFRATLANTVEADAFVSIHHNTGGAVALDHPGSEAYVSNFDPESTRLGGLIVDEMRRALAAFDADWTGGNGSGLLARIGSEGGDYYTLIEVAEVPTAIVEGAYISNPSEEALAKTDAFRQAYAEAVYRALVRFITTEDNPIPDHEVQNYNPGGGTRDMSDCVVPPQE